MPKPLPLILSFNGGYSDTAGFLALEGLFTAHVTGNFVTLGAALVHNTSGSLVKFLALPAFCCTIFVLRFWALSKLKRHPQPFRILLLIQTLFLLAGGISAVFYGPFTHNNGGGLLLTGLLLVVGMAIQNAAHRIHLTSAPPSTLMTGTTTQIMIDLADWTHTNTQPEEKKMVQKRLMNNLSSMLAFASGCAIGAIGVAFISVWCFLFPPLFSLIAAFLAQKEKTS